MDALPFAMPSLRGLNHDGSVDLGAFSLTEDQLAARRHFVGGSDATIIGHGDPQQLIQLWEFKRGGPSVDLSHELPPMLGIWTEPFNLAWTERRLGRRFSRQGEVVVHDNLSWMRATLDAWDQATPAVVQAKHVNGFWKPDALIGHYIYQLHHEMYVTGARLALLTVIFGNNKHEIFEIPFDELLAGQLLEAEEDFWRAVQSGHPPVAMEVEAPPPAPATLIPIDMTGSNEFADAASRWLEHRSAAEVAIAAEAALKALTPTNASKAFGYGVEVTQNARGAKSVRVQKETKS